MSDTNTAATTENTVTTDTVAYPQYKTQINFEKGIDLVVLLDLSGSMDERDEGGTSRIDAAWEAFASKVRKFEKFDPDGFDLILFSEQFRTRQNKYGFVVENNVTSAALAKVKAKFSPDDGTCLSEPLQYALKMCMDRRAKEGRPQLIWVLTDGAATHPSVDSELRTIPPIIVAAVNQMKRKEDMAICFNQVGHDKKAGEFLELLNGGLEQLGAKFDAVSKYTMEQLRGKSAEEQVLMAFNG